MAGSPTDETTRQITNLLVRMRDGESGAQNQLFPLIYDELRAIAANRLGPRHQDRTLGTTALVHEAFIKLFDRTHLEWSDRSHFFKVASMAMRQIITDRARAHLAARRGGGAEHVDVDDAASVGDAAADRAAEEAIDLERALVELETHEPRLAEMVQLRFYGGLSVEETAEALDVSDRTVKRDWRRARAILHDRLNRDVTPE